MKPFPFALALPIVLAVFAAHVPPAAADPKSKAAQEAAEYVLRRFGKQAAKEGTHVLARRIEQTALRHGDDVFQAVRKLGPRGLHLVEEAGTHGKQAARVLANHGEHGAVWVVSRPKGMALFLKHGDQAATVLIKHPGLAEPLVERLGPPAIRALQATGPQSARRLAMLAEGGELARIARAPELLDVIAKYGDRAMTFVWNHKGALAVSTVLAAFLADPEPFIQGTKDITQVVAENAVKPVAEVPGIIAREAAGDVARNTNWTAVFIAGPLVLVLLAAAWIRRRLPLRSITTNPPSECRLVVQPAPSPAVPSVHQENQACPTPPTTPNL